MLGINQSIGWMTAFNPINGLPEHKQGRKLLLTYLNVQSPIDGNTKASYSCIRNHEVSHGTITDANTSVGHLESQHS